MAVGPGSKFWDICFIAEYPNVATFIEMMRDPICHEAMTHRQAGVIDSRLIRPRQMSCGAGFANPDAVVD